MGNVYKGKYSVRLIYARMPDATCGLMGRKCSKIASLIENGTVARVADDRIAAAQKQLSLTMEKKR